MARKRMIDPDFWSDEKLGMCTRDERLLFMGLISNSDDEGRGRANSKLLKSNIFPYDEDLTYKKIELMLMNIASKNIVILYKVDGQEFYYLQNFHKHQNINRPSPSKLPIPTDENILTEYSLNTHGVLTPKRKEKNIKEDNICLAVINYLNKKADTKFKTDTQKTKYLISDRLNENFTEQDFIKVIDNKCTEWLKTDMQKFLRPETLFGTKFEGYLNQKIDTPKHHMVNMPSEEKSQAAIDAEARLDKEQEEKRKAYIAEYGEIKGGPIDLSKVCKSF